MGKLEILQVLAWWDVEDVLQVDYALLPYGYEVQPYLHWLYPKLGKNLCNRFLYDLPFLHYDSVLPDDYLVPLHACGYLEPLELSYRGAYWKACGSGLDLYVMRSRVAGLRCGHGLGFVE